MNGKEILVDTNIVIYLLNQNDTLEELLQGKHIYLSFITELELIGFRGITATEEKQIEALLHECSIINMNNSIKEKYIEVRKKYKLKLADSIIAATAIASGLPLITADKQFKSIEE